MANGAIPKEGFFERFARGARQPIQMREQEIAGLQIGTEAKRQETLRKGLINIAGLGGDPNDSVKQFADLRASLGIGGQLSDPESKALRRFFESRKKPTRKEVLDRPPLPAGTTVKTPLLGGAEVTRKGKELPKTEDAFIVDVASDIAQGKAITPGQQKALDFIGKQGLKTAKEVNDLTVKLRGKFDAHAIPKVFNIVSSQIGIIEEAFDEATNIDLGQKSRVGSDQALIISFNKMLDPDSVVRESEFARTPEQVSVLNRLKSIMDKVVSGGLLMADTDRQAILDMARRAAAVHGRIYNDFIDAQSEFGEAVGVSKDVLFAGVKRHEGPTEARQPPITATNPQTGERQESFDGGQTWQPIQ